jgi:hypothetical protein
MSNDELRVQISGLSDAQLRHMVNVTADEYRPEAIAIANEQLVLRELNPGPEDGDSEQPTHDCLRCKSEMSFGGQKRFHEGARLGVLGGLGELLVNREYFDMWVCQKCGHVEFFMEV